MLTLLVALLLVVSAVAGGGHGSLDKTFGAGGKVTTAFGARDAKAQALGLVIQSDGKLVAAGTSYTRSNAGWALARYNPDGSLDPSFGSGGKVTTASGSYDAAQDLVIQNDGKLVAAGSAAPVSNDVWALARYNPDGSLDPSFGSGGKVTTPMGTQNAEAEALVIQSDGKLVAAGSGYSQEGSHDVWALARYNPDGSLDPSFGSGGTVMTPMGAGDAAALAIAIQRDGKLVVAGDGNGGNGRFTLARYNTDGSLDNTFGSGGHVTMFGAVSWAAAVRMTRDGKILAAGSSGKSLGAAGFLVLARFNADGSLDRRFGSGGKVTTRIGANDAPGSSASSLAIQRDGRLVVAGSSYSPNAVWALARYNANGSLDRRFWVGGQGDDRSPRGRSFVACDPGPWQTGSRGHKQREHHRRRLDARPLPRVGTRSGRIDSSPSHHLATRLSHFPHLATWRPLKNARRYRPIRLLVQSRARSWMKFMSTRRSSVLTFGLALLFALPLRLAAASGGVHGSLDRSFGSGGRVRTVIGSDAFAEALAIQADGKLVAAGGSDRHFALARYDRDGSLDRSFATRGTVTVPMGPYCCAAARAVVIQPDGKVVGAGESSNHAAHEDEMQSAGALVRFNPDGSLDRSFGKGGKVTAPVAAVSALVLQPDGKLVITGDDFTLVRYTASGKLDRTFGSNGKAATPIRSGGGSFQAWDLALQPDGKLLQAGYSLSGFTLARHNSNGSLDRSFGRGGIVTTPFGKWNAEAQALAVQQDGKLVAAGGGQGDPHGTEVVFELARYNTNGTLDRSFGTGGRVTTAIGSSDGEALALVIQPDGKLVAAGTSGPNNLFTLVRYKPNGSLDTSFGSRGIVITAGPGSAGEGAYALGIQTDGKLIAAGSAGRDPHSRFALARYNG